MISPDEFASKIRVAADQVRPSLEVIVAEVVVITVSTAKGLIGHLQDGWDPLAPSTIKDKSSLGFGPPDYSPLERTGEMRDSIEGDADGLTGTVGSANKKALWHEIGTDRSTGSSPPRPFISRALNDTMPILAEKCGELAVRLLGGEE